MKNDLSVFNYVWDVTFQNFRLKLTPKYHSSWNTVYRVAKMTDWKLEPKQDGESVH